jgi:hypothetical protein
MFPWQQWLHEHASYITCTLSIVFLVANITRAQGLKLLFTLQSNFQFTEQIQTKSGIKFYTFHLPICLKSSAFLANIKLPCVRKSCQNFVGSYVGGNQHMDNAIMQRAREKGAKQNAFHTLESAR